MPHQPDNPDRLLLDDGTSYVLLNIGDKVLLNADNPDCSFSEASFSSESFTVCLDTPGIHKVGDFGRVSDFRDFRAPAKRFVTCIIDISCRIQIFVTPLVESKIRRKESTEFNSRIRRESLFEGLSKIYHNSLHEAHGRITHKPRTYEIKGNNFKQEQNQRYNKILEDNKSKKTRKEKMDIIKDLFKEYKDEF